MTAICARSKQLIHTILDKIEGASRLGVCRCFSRYSRFSCVGREKFNHFIVGKIQDDRHLTGERSNKVFVKQFFYHFRQNRRRFMTEWEISITGSNI